MSIRLKQTLNWSNPELAKQESVERILCISSRLMTLQMDPELVKQTFLIGQGPLNRSKYSSRALGWSNGPFTGQAGP